MASSAQIIARARALVTMLIRQDAPHSPFAWQGFTEQERRDVLTLAIYSLQRRPHRGQRAAMQLLRSWLTPRQRQQLARVGDFYVRGSAGGTYRLRPSNGRAQLCHRYGRRYFADVRYCYHDAAGELPPADVTLAQLLLLRADEPAFLAAANAHPLGEMRWSGAWPRRLREARLRRAQEAA